jgi:hypothetical protein
MIEYRWCPLLHLKEVTSKKLRKNKLKVGKTYPHLLHSKFMIWESSTHLIQWKHIDIR